MCYLGSPTLGVLAGITPRTPPDNSIAEFLVSCAQYWRSSIVNLYHRMDTSVAPAATGRLERDHRNLALCFSICLMLWLLTKPTSDDNNSKLLWCEKGLTPRLRVMM